MMSLFRAPHTLARGNSDLGALGFVVKLTAPRENVLNFSSDSNSKDKQDKL